MRITLDVHMIINHVKTVKSGQFQVMRQTDIPQVAYDWIKSIRRETGYYGHQSLIEKIIVNGEHNIVLAVKEIEDKPIPDLDFPW